jgi:hypothetical protein
MALFCVRGYKSPLHPFLSLSLSLAHLWPATTRNSFTPLLTPPWPWFGEICWGFKEGLRARAWRVLVSWFPISRAPRSSLGWHISCLLLLELWAPNQLGVVLEHPKDCGCPRRFVSPRNWVSNSSLIFVVARGRKVT